jgi:Ca2+-binding RTX toxin-like protein
MTPAAASVSTSADTSQIRYGGSGADVIAAGQKMIFDWAPDAGNSNVWTEDRMEEVQVWNEEWGQYFTEFVTVRNSGASPSTASGTVVFDTPMFGQSFLEGPVEFNYSSSTDGRHWTESLATFDYPGQWTWNPQTRTLDPNWAGSSPDDHNSFNYYHQTEISTSVNYYDYGYNQTEYGHWVVRETGDLTAFGGGGNDRIYGGTGNDRLFGEAGDDEIYGGLGSSFLSGGSGNDTLHSGPGDTVMTGGSGADTFVFNSQSGGSDKVMDFNLARDKILVQGIADAPDLDAVLDAMIDLGGSTLINLSGNHPVLLIGVDAADLTARAATVFEFA